MTALRSMVRGLLYDRNERRASGTGKRVTQTRRLTRFHNAQDCEANARRRASSPILLRHGSSRYTQDTTNLGFGISRTWDLACMASGLTVLFSATMWDTTLGFAQSNVFDPGGIASSSTTPRRRAATA